MNTHTYTSDLKLKLLYCLLYVHTSSVVAMAMVMK